MGQSLLEKELGGKGIQGDKELDFNPLHTKDIDRNQRCTKALEFSLQTHCPQKGITLLREEGKHEKHEFRVKNANCPSPYSVSPTNWCQHHLPKSSGSHGIRIPEILGT